MKRLQTIFLGLLVFSVMAVLAPNTQAQTCDNTHSNFVDLDGDSFNDNAPDQDGDGIPNGLDPDYVKYSKDGTSMQKGKLHKNGTADVTMSKFHKRNRFGKANSAKYQNRAYKGSTTQTSGSDIGVCDGSGPRGGSVVCDGSGPEGPQGRRGRH